MRLKSLEIIGFKSFAKKVSLEFPVAISSIVGPNGSGKSNVAEAMRFVLGEQSIKSMRGKKGEDLIFNGTEHTGRLNHAKVTVTFDNTDRAFNIDYDEVSVSREVFRDSSHQYYINGSQVRLKDVLELLSGVHIGASSHHIISQGEADRILNASPKERKGMIEDALGLKIYHWKINESEKKLLKTEENLKDIQMLQREIAPHLKFLKKQVEKIERSHALREELAEKYKEYLKREDVYLKAVEKHIFSGKDVLYKKIKEADDEIERLKKMIEDEEHDLKDDRVQVLLERERELSAARNKRSEIVREAGKIEGMIEYEERRKRDSERQKERLSADTSANLKASMREVEDLILRLEEITSVDGDTASYETLKEVIGNIRSSVKDFREKHAKKEDAPEEDDTAMFVSALPELQEQLGALQNGIQELVSKERSLAQEMEEIRAGIEKDKGEVHEAERMLYAKKSERAEHSTRLENILTEEVRYNRDLGNFEAEVRDGVSLIGARVREYHDFAVEEDVVRNEDREDQEKRRRDIERTKMRIEDLGGGSGEDVMKEYKEVEERDIFLSKEIHDLTESATSLRGLIADLDQQLDQEFQSGITKINKQFEDFFSLMFGGGNAALSIISAEVRRKKSELEEVLTDEVPSEEVEETGIDITVSLPRKKIKGLQMLSGGERALTSIALLFAVSQVNPPPFMILDETDAALDEANSRKYGDMLENLSKVSQLIVITHNRETMSRAGILYGVTMDGEATSKLLSVQLAEAEAIAK